MVFIETEQDYDNAMLEIHNLSKKGFAHLSPKEEDMLHELSVAVEKWELINVPNIFDSGKISDLH